MRITPPSARPARRGVILLVVLALLTLFAIIGITFVLVANSQETTARIAREAEQQTQPNFDGEQALAMALSQLIYDVPDDANGINSGLRGHSLARLMYGYNSGTDPVTGLPVANDKAYCGTGRLHNAVSLPGLGNDEAYLVNYTYFASDGLGYRCPERVGFQPSLAAAAAQPYTGGANVPYTYPDHQNFSLAYIDPTTGQVLVPSFHREYLFGPLHDPSNPNWTNAQGKYLTCRPRPQEHPGFPLPGDRWGDVKNLDGAPGGNDSIWIDPGFPVMTNADGRKYKVMVAPLIIELDSRMNLNVAGNLVGNSTWATSPTSMSNTIQVTNASTPASNQGWGPWEVNPAYVLNVNATSTTAEWKNIFYGASTAGVYPGATRAHVMGRYGANRVPGDPLPGGNTSPRGWAPVDYNGLDEKTGTTTNTGYVLPGVGSNSPYAAFPSFPANRYGTGSIVPNPTDPSYPYPAEFFTHPRYYNPLRSAPLPAPINAVTGVTSISDTRVLPIHAMHKLLRYNSTGGDYISSDLLRLLPVNLGSDSNAAIRRNLVTLASFDIDRPGVTPYIWDPTGAQSPSSAGTLYNMNTTLTPPYPQGGAISFPTPGQRNPVTPGTNPPANSEFDAASWRSTLAILGRVNLNRSLTNFPPPDKNGVSTNASQALQALADRQQFASDIFTRLVQVTTGYATPATACSAAYSINPVGQSPQYQALRYLAQLSANIVDYIDVDDQSTPFNWFTPPNGSPMISGQTALVPEWVFGTETPRLVINEAYAQYDNTLTYNGTTDPMKNGAGTYVAANPYSVNVWIELFNPLQADPVSTGSGTTTGTQDTTARLQTNAATPQNLYQVVLANSTTAQSVLANPANTAGDPNFQNTTGTTNIYSTVTNFGTGDSTGTVQPFPTPTQTATSASNVGLYVLGPPSTGATNVFLTGTSMEATPRTYAANPNLPVTYASPQMSYQPPATVANQALTPANQPATITALPPPIVLLQRLACPLLPPNPNMSSSSYNPYITIDSFAFQPPAPAANPNPNLPVVFDTRYFDSNGALSTTGIMTGIQRNGQSYGRVQPFANVTPQVFAQNPSQQVPNQPNNTFFSHNNPLSTFYWNTHLDRNLISPVELLFVHGARPMDLTAQFVTSTGALNTARYAPWLDQASRLHRFLEIVETAPITAGVAAWGRIPGRININGVWPASTVTPGQSDVFYGLCDPQPGNVFTQADVTTAFTNMMKQRSPNVGVISGSTTSPQGNTWSMPGPTDQQLVTAANAFFTTGYSGSIAQSSTVSGGQWQLDRPFWGNAPGYANGADAMAQSSAAGRGLDNTLLRAATVGATSGPRTLSVTNSTATHPYQQAELLNKIYNSVTTRSNVFAVYLTVGFFTVTNDPATPVQIGAEVGRAENRQVRHRMFAIVDRSNLTNFSTTSTGAIAAPVTPASPSSTVQPTQAVPIAATGTNPNTGNNWALQTGMYLTFEPNTNNEETVLVQPGNVASFNLAHAQGVTVINRGNPGPWQRYDPRKDGGVVPYFAIID